MVRTSIPAMALGLAACLSTLTFSPAAQAGGFGLLVELPASQPEGAQPDDALVVVRAVGCHGPGAAVSAKAEGLVNGRRVSMPIRLDHLGNQKYTIKRQWPEQGAWVVVLSAKSERLVGPPERRFRPTCSGFFELAADGSVRNVKTVAQPDGSETKLAVRLRYFSSQDKAGAINTALRALAKQGSQVSRARGGSR